MQNGTITSFNRSTLSEAPTTIGVYLFKKGNEYIYIGKSVNLRARLLSHFEDAKTDTKEAAIFSQSDRVEYVITDSEFKALIYEAHLIRTHKPQYNVRWRDDKSFLYIKITQKEVYPRILVTRLENDGLSHYFGPFSSMRVVLSLLRELRRIFPFCMQKKLSKQSCFYSKIGLCDPCPSAIERIKDEVKKKHLQTLYRRNIRSVSRILEGKTEAIEKKLQKRIDECVSSEEFEQAIPLRNSLYKLERLIIKKHFGDQPDAVNTSVSQVKHLRHLLHPFFSEITLERIECYDMSTFAFRESTASLVVFTQGLSDKKEYRRFKIKNFSAESDFEMFYEVLHRRFKKEWQLPDLVVVDGGKPQVRVARKVLSELKINIPLIGIAKRPDRLVIGIEDFPLLRPPRDNPGFMLVQALRDEAHRFAKKYHVTLREKKIML